MQHKQSLVRATHHLFGLSAMCVCVCVGRGREGGTVHKDRQPNQRLEEEVSLCPKKDAKGGDKFEPTQPSVQRLGVPAVVS